jgi:5-methylthioadenosine/S-adenosylhomocysteine deaminase
MSRALTITGAHLPAGGTGGLRAVDGIITEFGPAVAPQPGDDHLDAAGLTIAPPLVNGHTHAAMTLLRGYGDDLALMEWLQTRIWPAEARLTPEHVYWGTRLAAVEMIRSGTLRFWDMYFHVHDVARAVVDSGLRATVSQVILEIPGAPADARPEAAEEGIARLADAGPLITPCLGPHAIYTVGADALRLVAEVSARHGVLIHIHLAETSGEVEDCVREHGLRPAAYLDTIGLLTPRTVLAHGVHLDDAELALVAERGATLVTCPVSNMKLAVGGAFPYPAARAAGCAIGIGTDGAASNNSLDLLQDVKVLALLQKHTTNDPAALPAADAWAIATGARAPGLGATPLEIGRPADLLLLDLDTPEVLLAPFDAALVYSATGSVVDTAIVDGRVLMRHRAIDGEDEVRARAREAAAAVRGDH